MQGIQIDLVEVEEFVLVEGHKAPVAQGFVGVAAVLAVADTFDTARLTNRDLFAADLAAPRLLRTMARFTGRYTRDLSAGATSLYDRVLADCCAATEADNHRAALRTITTEGGVFGAVADSAALLAALI